MKTIDKIEKHLEQISFGTSNDCYEDEIMKTVRAVIPAIIRSRGHGLVKENVHTAIMYAREIFEAVEDEGLRHEVELARLHEPYRVPFTTTEK